MACESSHVHGRSDGPFPWLARAALAASRRSSMRTANPSPRCAAPAYVPWPSSSCIPKKSGTPVIEKWSETSRSPLELRSRRLVVEPAEELSATSTLPPRELRPLNIAWIPRPVAPARFDNRIGPANPGVGSDRTAALHTRATRSWRVSGRRGVPIIDARCLSSSGDSALLRRAREQHEWLGSGKLYRRW